MSLKKPCQEGNKWITTATVFSSVAGLSRALPEGKETLTDLGLFFFFIVMRTKFYLEDEEFFETTKDFGSDRFRNGLLFASLSWLAMIVAISSVGKVDIFCISMIVSFSLSSCWILIVGTDDQAHDLHPLWLKLNFIYMILLLVTIYAEINRSQSTEYIVIAGLIATALYDWRRSKPLDRLDRSSSAPKTSGT